ncbi:hypothetical protein [Corallococcus carmarthensis]|uniref:hypothetical protein n=1 Tax=Corallococcus carmarthensis TaxID=2316728 RepID=UPI00148D7909|nr:hypothetical protein [Corallococcus carmarthensis]NOK19982.1 hypothetical protein [Corallococcus carmarthensis]
MHRRSLRSLAPSWLRPLTLSSFALGGLLVATPAHAAEASEAPATLLDVSMQDGELTARIRWSAEPEDLPEEVEVLSYDGTDTLTAGERVTPKAGEETEVKLSGAVQEPWETGWAQRLVVREAKGRELTRQPYDVSLACEDEKTCELTAAPGISASREVLHVSNALQETLAVIEKEQDGKAFDLVHEVARRDPSLFGEALTHAQGLVKYGAAEGCGCTWEASYARSNTQGTGLGAAHDVFARPLATNRPSKTRLTAQGTSQMTLSLRCASLDWPRLQLVGIKQPGGVVKPVLLPQPVYSTCAGTCSGRFTHFARITGAVSAVSTNNPFLDGSATEQSKYHLGNGLSPLLNWTESAPNDNTFIQATTAYNVGSGSGFVQTSGEASYNYNGNSSMGVPRGRAQGGYLMAVQGTVACPGGGLYPIGRAWDIATTMGNETFLNDGVTLFFDSL